MQSASPAIVNTDQGSQFTSGSWIDVLTEADVSIRMDGRGRAFDNVFTEQLWRSVKYEEVYLKDYEGVDAARIGLGEYLRFCNTSRPHQSLGYRTTAEIHFGLDGSESNHVSAANKKEKGLSRMICGLKTSASLFSAEPLGAPEAQIPPPRLPLI